MRVEKHGGKFWKVERDKNGGEKWTALRVRGVKFGTRCWTLPPTVQQLGLYR